MNLLIKGLCLTIAASLVGCGGGYDELPPNPSGVIESSSGSNNSDSSGDDGDNAVKCFEANVLNITGIRVIDGDTVEVTPLSEQSERCHFPYTMSIIHQKIFSSEKLYHQTLSLFYD
ncbi:hypothetical protein ACT3TI_06800 [Psychrobacter sp. AOP22-C1-22]|uniref:hypothetical protein n=1 Tax=unclassified Psychrobacter TaxID=196806 RepID=UPI001787DA3D|nr:hypothetical protein [Psychrobacter sp. FME6]MBE0406516.1 hypothetical protein [Psychrobacter sp. FME6]